MKYIILTLILSISATVANSQIRIADGAYKVVLYKTLDMNTNEASTHPSTGIVEMVNSPNFENTLVIKYEESIGEKSFLCMLEEGFPNGEDYVEKYSLMFEDGGVSGAIFYSALPAILEGVKYNIGLVMPDGASGVLHQIFLSTETETTDFSQSIIENESDNEFWSALKGVFSDIMEEKNVKKLKGEPFGDGNSHYIKTTLDLSKLTRANEHCTFEYAVTTALFTDEIEDQYIKLHVGALTQWVSSERSEKEWLSDVLIVEQIIDDLAPSNLVKVYYHFEEDMNMGEINARQAQSYRNHIKDDVYWIDEKEVDVHIDYLEKDHIYLNQSDYGMAFLDYQLDVKFIQPQ